MTRKHLTLALGVSIPVLMILFVVGSIYLPRYWAPKPRTDFLYSMGPERYYVSSEGHLLRTEIEDPKTHPSQQTKTVLYQYDVSKDQSVPVKYAQVRSWKLDPRSISPEGYELVHGQRTEGFFPFLFASRDYDRVYLKGHSNTRRLNVNWHQYSPYRFRFLGWIKQTGNE